MSRSPSATDLCGHARRSPGVAPPSDRSPRHARHCRGPSCAGILALLLAASGAGCGADRPPAGPRAQADAQPAGSRLQVKDAQPAGSRLEVKAAGDGITVGVPPGWHLIRERITSTGRERITDTGYPVGRLLLTSYPTRRGGRCAPDAAERDLPPDGALVYLLEYRPARGAVWAGLDRGDFPRRPQRFSLRGIEAQAECWRVPTRALTFRDGDRPFQADVAFGAKATPARRAQAVRALDSLQVKPLPPPPPRRTP